jgi:hypothetical protein
MRYRSRRTASVAEPDGAPRRHLLSWPRGTPGPHHRVPRNRGSTAQLLRRPRRSTLVFAETTRSTIGRGLPDGAERVHRARLPLGGRSLSRLFATDGAGVG